MLWINLIFYVFMMSSTGKTLRFTYWDYQQFNLNTIWQDERKTELRFGKTEILVLADSRQIPGVFT